MFHLTKMLMATFVLLKSHTAKTKFTLPEPRLFFLPSKRRHTLKDMCSLRELILPF